MERWLLLGSLLLSIAIASVIAAHEPEWNPANVKPCDRACLARVMDTYMNAIYKHDPKLAPPLAKDYRMTENTGVIEVGEGMLWRRQVTPTTFSL
jgi:hypothetical protein